MLDTSKTHAPQPDAELREQFRRTIDEGVMRLRRPWPSLLATGFIGGIDVSAGVLALLLIYHDTGSELLAGLGFSIGFIALTLGRSELFTENFLVPVAAAVAHRAHTSAVGRLWFGTLLTNLVAGWLFTWVIVLALPELASAAVERARVYPELGIGVESFMLGVLGGVAITVMTWMQRGTSGDFGKVASAMVVGFLLAGAGLNHVIVVSLEMFAALHVGAPFGYLDWLGVAAWAALANVLGGLVLVTVLRLIQVGGGEVAERRKRTETEREDTDEPVPTAGSSS